MVRYAPAVYEYEAPQGPTTASYQIRTANRTTALREVPRRPGNVMISQRSDRTRLYPELGANKIEVWRTCLEKGYLTIPPEWREMLEKQHLRPDQFATFLRVKESRLGADSPVSTSP